jgi:hypothetical protein
MEYFNPENIQRKKCDRDFVIKNLKLIPIEEDNQNIFFKLNSDLLFTEIVLEHLKKIPLNNPDSFLEYFDNIKLIEPDKVCRPKGDTTFFTTAGVQYIETFLKRDKKLKKEKFMVAQPVIRSQFMDKVKEGVSTSFINFSIESLDSNPDEFIELSKKFIQLVISQGIDVNKIKFQIEELPDQWGDRKFNKTVLTLYFNDIEIGECVYIHGYPVTESKKIDIIDIGFGVERLNWGIGNNKNYFSDFDKFYSNKFDSNEVAASIDCIRTATLIAAEGVKPSNHDHGYRLRQLLKRFVIRNQKTKFDLSELVSISYDYWLKWGFKPVITKSQTLDIIKQEYERNWNNNFLSLLKEHGGFDIYVDINQPSEKFLKQVEISLPQEGKEIVKKLIEQLK